MAADKLDGPAVRPTKRSPKVEFAVNAEKVEVGEFITESVVYCSGIKSDIVRLGDVRTSPVMRIGTGWR